MRVCAMCSRILQLSLHRAGSIQVAFGGSKGELVFDVAFAIFGALAVRLFVFRRGEVKVGVVLLLPEHIVGQFRDGTMCRRARCVQRDLCGLRRGGRSADKLGRRLRGSDERDDLGADRGESAWPGVFDTPLKIAETLQLPFGLRQRSRVPADSSGAPHLLDIGFHLRQRARYLRHQIGAEASLRLVGLRPASG